MKEQVRERVAGGLVGVNDIHGDECDAYAKTRRRAEEHVREDEWTCGLKIRVALWQVTWCERARFTEASARSGRLDKCVHVNDVTLVGRRDCMCLNET